MAPTSSSRASASAASSSAIHDEAVAQRHGIVGQETVGPAGFAMAVRTIPQMVEVRAEIARSAPRAWIINFTNPVGMVTEAMRTVSDRVIGICDTPTELFEEVARALGLRIRRSATSTTSASTTSAGCARSTSTASLSSSGCGGSPSGCALSIRCRCSTPASLRELRLLPTEYVYYYDQPARAFDNVRRAGSGRGQVIEELTRALFEDLARRAPIVSRATRPICARAAPATCRSSRAATSSAPPPATGLSGYDRIALACPARHPFQHQHDHPAQRRATAAPFRALDEDVVEVPCVVNANGARPLHVGHVPERVAPLLTRVRDYERLTVGAALTQSVEAARDALARNPLVPEGAIDRLVADLSPLW